MKTPIFQVLSDELVSEIKEEFMIMPDVFIGIIRQETVLRHHGQGLHFVERNVTFGPISDQSEGTNTMRTILKSLIFSVFIIY